MLVLLCYLVKGYEGESESLFELLQVPWRVDEWRDGWQWELGLDLLGDNKHP